MVVCLRLFGSHLFLADKKGMVCKGKRPALSYGISFALITVYMSITLCLGLVQGSDSGFAALFAGLLTILILSVKEEDKMIRFWEIGLILCLLSQGVRLTNHLFPGRITHVSGPLQLLSNGNLTLIGGFVCVAVILLLKLGKQKKCYPVRGIRIAVWSIVIVLGAALLGFITLIVINTLRPGSIGSLSDMEIFTFNGGWGSKRGVTWGAGMWAFWNQNWLHKLIGIGPDCMSAYLYSGADLALEEFANYWLNDARLTNAHGEWITVLLNMGIIGLIGYAGAIISGIVRFVKNRNVHWFVAAAGICLITYTANNIFSFQQTVNGSAIFLIWGIAEGILREKQDKT